MLDYEPDLSDKADAELYADFLGALGTASHPQKVQTAMCVSDWGILDYYDLYAKQPLDTMMSMAGTYFGTNITKNQHNLQLEHQGGASPSQIAVGVGSMMTDACASRAKWQYNWTMTGLTSFVQWIEAEGLAEAIDVWRSDIDNQGPWNCTEPYYFDLLAAWLKQ
mmetsp:Transcript_65946/g.155783  ORF Transcript_65946/g.155783 Transcript_65946/m.155783 type:complete len:165 (-) Transcript_65946:16-510(-)